MKNILTSRFTILIFILSLSLTITSCTALWLKFSGVYNEKPKLKSISNGQKNVVYIPLQHIGRIEYYKDMSKKIDSLTEIGYVVFYESITTDLEVTTDSVDRSEYIRLAKKFRKIQGSFQAGNGYLDTINNKIYGTISYNEKYDLINQPNYFDMGVDSLTSVNADVTLEDLLGAFEEKNGTIVLNDCDINTDLDSNYICEPLSNKLRRDFKKNFALGMRNTNLAKLIDEHNSDKILVIYGVLHFKGLLKELKLIDDNWIEKK